MSVPDQHLSAANMSSAELGAASHDVSRTTLHNTSQPTAIVPEFKGGAVLHQALTPGGHPADTTQAYFPDYHRKFADPSAFSWIGMGTCFIQTGIVYFQARGINLHFIQVLLVPYAFLGFLLLTLSTIFEFMAGRTFSSTMYGVFAGYFAGFVVLYVPWFGLTGSYDGVKPNMYAKGGEGAAELNSLTGMYASGECPLVTDSVSVFRDLQSASADGLQRMLWSSSSLSSPRHDSLERCLPFSFPSRSSSSCRLPSSSRPIPARASPRQPVLLRSLEASSPGTLVSLRFSHATRLSSLCPRLTSALWTIR